MAPRSQTADRRAGIPVYITAFLKLRSYGTEVRQMFTQCIARSSQMIWLYIFNWYSAPFRYVKVTNESESADFAHLTLKLVAVVKALERSEKEGQIKHLRSNTQCSNYRGTGAFFPLRLCIPRNTRLSAPRCRPLLLLFKTCTIIPNKSRSSTTANTKFGENRSGESWDNLSKMFILKKETTGCTSFTFVNSGVTGPKVT